MMNLAVHFFGLSLAQEEDLTRDYNWGSGNERLWAIQHKIGALTGLGEESPGRVSRQHLHQHAALYQRGRAFRRRIGWRHRLLAAEHGAFLHRALALGCSGGIGAAADPLRRHGSTRKIRRPALAE